ncbi:hypothetical protein BDW62DRAFT_198671 [Aspergillus aurantiobrunneus]
MTTQQPSQPPKQSAYTQASNPVKHSPYETAQSHAHEQRSYGTAPASITRGASSKPSTSQSLLAEQQRHQASLRAMQREGDVDTEYGVEEQPDEGAIARAVEDHSRHRMQAGAHAGAVGTAQGPGAPAVGEGVDTMADLARKREEHARILGERVGRTPPVPDGETAERERLRVRKLRENRELHVGDVVREATGDPVVGR